MMVGDEFYGDDVTSGPIDCEHGSVEWGDGLEDLETGRIEDPDHLGVCQSCGVWMMRKLDGSEVRV